MWRLFFMIGGGWVREERSHTPNVNRIQTTMEHLIAGILPYVIASSVFLLMRAGDSTFSELGDQYGEAPVFFLVVILGTIFCYLHQYRGPIRVFFGSARFNTILNIYQSKFVEKIRASLLLVIAFRDLWSMVVECISLFNSCDRHGIFSVIYFLLVIGTAFSWLAFLFFVGISGLLAGLFFGSFFGQMFCVVQPETMVWYLVFLAILSVITAILFYFQSGHSLYFLVGITYYVFITTGGVDQFGYVWISGMILFIGNSDRIPFPIQSLEFVTTVAWIINQIRLQPWVVEQLRCVDAREESML